MKGAGGTLVQRVLGMSCGRLLAVALSFEQRLWDRQDRHLRNTRHRIDMASRRLVLDGGLPEYGKAKEGAASKGDRIPHSDKGTILFPQGMSF